jgi:hypothetical protein
MISQNIVQRICKIVTDLGMHRDENVSTALSKQKSNTHPCVLRINVCVNKKKIEKNERFCSKIIFS